MSTDYPKSGRLDLRVSEFLLEAGITAANRVLEDRRRFELSTDQWEFFQAALDAPAQTRQRLKRLMDEPGLPG